MVALALSALATGTDAYANALNSNSVIQDGIEYYVETDKPAYSLGEDVCIFSRVTNMTDTDVTFQFANQQQFMFAVYDSDTMIWLTPTLVSPALSSLTLHPGESASSSEVWDQTYRAGTEAPWYWEEEFPSPPGVFDVFGGLMYYALQMGSVPIEIVPEPSTLTLLCAGAFFLRLRRR